MAWARLEQRVKRFLLGRLERLLARPPAEIRTGDLAAIRSILVIRQHDMYGDFLLSTPVFGALRARFPEARIGACVRETFGELLQHTPTIDEVIIVPRDRRQWSFRAFIDLWRGIRKGWDVAVVLNTVSHSLTSDLLAVLSRARLTVGSESPPLAGATRNFLYDVNVPLFPGPRHQSGRNLDVVRVLGVDGADLAERITVTGEEKGDAARRLRAYGLSGRRPVVGIHPGAGKIKNRWPVERFAELADRVAGIGGEIILFWGPQETDLRELFLRHLKVRSVLVPPATLRQLASNLACCDLVVCNDTGVMHLCASVGTPLLAFFGPTSASEWKPVGEKFIPLQGEGSSVASVSVDMAFEALQRLLQDLNASHR
jgi:heptosyltransferase-2